MLDHNAADSLRRAVAPEKGSTPATSPATLPEPESQIPGTSKAETDGFSSRHVSAISTRLEAARTAGLADADSEDVRWLIGRVAELEAENTSARRIVDTQAAMLLAATNRRDAALERLAAVEQERDAISTVLDAYVIDTDAEVGALRERVATLTVALEHYADERNWIADGPGPRGYAVAQAALVLDAADGAAGGGAP